jgi:hypothetical protein
MSAAHAEEDDGEHAGEEQLAGEEGAVVEPGQKGHS